MAAIYHFDLPPLRRRILLRFLAVISLYAIFGVVMIAAVFVTSRMTPRIIHVNYDSIAASDKMRVAWIALASPNLYPEMKLPNLKDNFETALKFEEHNITEPGEAELAHGIRDLWDKSKTHLGKISNPDYKKMISLLAQLVQVNEKGMFKTAEGSSTLAHNIFLGGSAFFLVSLIIAIFMADGISSRLAFPLKKIAEVLRNRPAMGVKLKLPSPTSLELKVLNHELTQLWNRLNELRELNVEKINNQKDQLESILTFVEDAILVIDNKGSVIHCNEGVSKILGLKITDIIGHPWADLSINTDNYVYLRSVLASDPTQHQAIHLTSEGSKRAFSVRFREIKNDKGSVTATLYLFHDVTERRLTENLRREFIGVLSHELKTPLQSLSICADVLKNHSNRLDADGQLLIETINEDVSRIRGVANNFMQVGIENMHSLRLRFEPIDLGEMMKEWLNPFIILANDKKIKISYQKEGGGAFLTKIDKIKFPWIISNLLANAIRISPKESEIKVILKMTSQEVIVEITDMGPGIPEHIRNRMFDPYFQGPNTESNPEGSGFLGLGLTIAKEVVEAHNGKITFTPNIPTGAIFRVSVPLSQQAGFTT